MPNFFIGGQDIIAFFTGCCIAIFGWKKIFMLQFRTPLSIADIAMSDQSGETLTWYYFGHSAVLADIIALIQISGAALLLFKKTRLIALLLLLPVMLNILLINIFYQMNAGALFQSIVLTSGLIYLLLWYLPKIILVLLAFHEKAATNKKKRRWAITACGMILPFFFIFIDSRSMPKESSLYGKYEVIAFSINGKRMAPGATVDCDAMLTKIYFDINNVCVLEYNNTHRRLMAKYKFDETNKKLETEMTDGGTRRLLSLLVNNKNGRKIEMEGKFGSDAIQLIIAKMKEYDISP